MKRLFISIFLMFVVIGTLTTTQAVQHIITASASGGTISPAGPHPVANGTDQTFTFEPFNDCWEFDRIVIDEEPAVAPLPGQFTFMNVQNSHSIHVIFRQIEYVIEATSGPNGTITPDGEISVPCGTNRVFTFTPDTDYEVDSVWINDALWYPLTDPPGPKPASYQFTNVRGDSSIHVTFKAEELPPPQQFEIVPTVYPAAGGTITPGTTQIVNQGESSTSFAITTNQNYHIASIAIDGVVVEEWDVYDMVLTYTWPPFTDVQRNHTIHVVFEEHVSIRYVEIPELDVHPNPTIGRLNIVSGDVAISKIEVTNTLGNVVMVIENPADMLDLSALGKGTYFLRFTTTKGSTIRQIIRN